MSAEYKNLSLVLEGLEVKSSSEDGFGEFVGYASVFGNRDLQGDVIERGAFAKSLERARKQSGGFFPLLWQHDPSDPIGHFEAEEDSRGLKIKGKILLAIEKGRNTFELLKARIVHGLSIGYRVIRDELTKGGRLLKEVDLWETSVVTFPANPQARIVLVKNGDISQVEATRFVNEDDELSFDLDAPVESFDWEAAEKSEEQRALDDLLADGRKLLDNLKDETNKLRCPVTCERAEKELADWLTPRARSLANQFANAALEHQVRDAARNPVSVSLEREALAKKAAQIAADVLGLRAVPDVIFYRPQEHPDAAGWTCRYAAKRNQVFVSAALDGDDLMEVVAHEVFHVFQLREDSAGNLTDAQLEPSAQAFGRTFVQRYGGAV